MIGSLERRALPLLRVPPLPLIGISHKLQGVSVGPQRRGPVPTCPGISGLSFWEALKFKTTAPSRPILLPFPCRNTPMAFSLVSSRTAAARSLNSVHRLVSARAMSTAPAAVAGGRKYEWLVVVPDFPGVLEKRLEVRPYVYRFPALTSFVRLRPPLRAQAEGAGLALLLGTWLVKENSA